MELSNYFKNLKTPEGKIDVVLDTDAYNEIDDQFAIAYMIRSGEKLNIKGICAAPFHNENSAGPKDGMEKSYDEIFKLLKLAGREDLNSIVFKGSDKYLPDEKSPVESEAADFLANLTNEYSPEKPLYIVAIGAITNVASAILKNPAMCENTVIVWLGGHGAHYYKPASEFNMVQDIAAARVVLGSGVPFVQLPCRGVVDRMTISKPELEYWLIGKNPLATYLAENTIKTAEKYASGKPWTRVIWDIAPIAWLLNDNKKLMSDRITHSFLPCYDKLYAQNKDGHYMNYVYHIERDIVFEDLFKKLGVLL